MDDAAHLRRTIRRCTALLVATIGFTGWTLQPSEEISLPFLLATGAILYLVYEFFLVIPDYEDTDDSSSVAPHSDETGSDL